MWSRGGKVTFLFNPRPCSIVFILFFSHQSFHGKLTGVEITVRKRSELLFACRQGLRGKVQALEERHSVLLLGINTRSAPREGTKMKLASYLSGVREMDFIWIRCKTASLTPSQSFQSLKWCNHLKCMPYYTEKDAEHRYQKIAANKEGKEGRNSQESDAPYQTHTYGQTAPHVSENVAWFWAHCSHGGEWRMH